MQRRERGAPEEKVYGKAACRAVFERRREDIRRADVKATTLPDERILDAIGATGYAGTELGTGGYLPTSSDMLRRAFEVRGLELGSSFVPLPLEDIRTTPSPTTVMRRRPRFLNTSTWVARARAWTLRAVLRSCFVTTIAPTTKSAAKKSHTTAPVSTTECTCWSRRVDRGPPPRRARAEERRASRPGRPPATRSDRKTVATAPRHFGAATGPIGGALCNALLSRGHLVLVSVASAGRATCVPRFKARHHIEELVRRSELPHTILRPTLLKKELQEPAALVALEEVGIALPLTP